jgi:hypothetical protein
VGGTPKSSLIVANGRLGMGIENSGTGVEHCLGPSLDFKGGLGEPALVGEECCVFFGGFTWFWYL